jgi:hypothetical protein
MKMKIMQNRALLQPRRSFIKGNEAKAGTEPKVLKDKREYPKEKGPFRALSRF